jgi:aminopeptidase N
VGRLGSGGRRTRTERHLVAAARAEVRLEGKAPRFAYGNADEGGFFRPLHEPDELRALAGALDALTAVERMGLVGHQWALVRAGRAALPGLLDLALACGAERDADVLLALRGPLAATSRMALRALGAEADARLRARVAEAFRAGWDEVGFDAGPRDDDDRRLRRAALLVLRGEVAEDPVLCAAAEERCARYLEDRSSLEANLADPVVALAARRGDEALYERFLATATSARTPQERRRFLMGLADFRKPALVARTLELSLGEQVGTQDVAILLVRLLANREAREAAWGFMKRRWAALRRRMPPLLASRPIEALPALATPEWKRDVAAFFRAHPVPTAARAIRQTLEQFDLEAAFERREKERLARWLGQGDGTGPG